MPEGVTQLVIIGAGGHGAEVAAYALDLGLALGGAIDDVKPRGPWHVSRVIGGMGEIAAYCGDHESVQYITAFGSNGLRRQVVERIAAMGIANLTPARALRHPSAWSGASVEIGAGTLLAPNTIVTTRVAIGDHCILNVKASISHDCVVGSYSNINPGATVCGDVHIGEGCYIGAGATIIEKKRIGAWTVVGAGSVVTRDLPDGVTAVGVPARIIRRQGIPPAI